MEEKILTRHPQGKRGVNISKAKYEAMRGAIFKALRGRELTHAALVEAVEAGLAGSFEGSIPWYFECTKLDLEARGTVRRVAGEGPPKYRLHQAGRETL
jgi:hypothetical protein